jgi:dihydrofolate synthase/folylpolyglutamate synthase
LAQVGHPEREFVAIHVGGTNGKGSVATLIAAALRGSGWRVGLYTSPHLVSVCERMLVDGRPIPPGAFAMWTDRLRPEIERAEASFFEATTAIAFADFAARGVDIAVVEVGLGGRLDATNVITPIVAVVTTVGLEHTQYLGETIQDIAWEKAGIAKAGVPLVVGALDAAARRVVAEHGRDVGAPVDLVPADIVYSGPLALRGQHQRRNAALAQRALERLPGPWRVHPDAMRKAFAATTLPGRFDVRGSMIFDVAHNPEGMEVLAEALHALGPRRPVHALVGILSDKDHGGMLRRLCPVVDRLYMTNPASAPVERRWEPATVEAAVGPCAIIVEPDFDRALARVSLDAETVLVTGSFHTVGDAMARLPGFAPLG